MSICVLVVDDTDVSTHLHEQNGLQTSSFLPEKVFLPWSLSFDCSPVSPTVHPTLRLSMFTDDTNPPTLVSLLGGKSVICPFNWCFLFLVRIFCRSKKTTDSNFVGITSIKVSLELFSFHSTVLTLYLRTRKGLCHYRNALELTTGTSVLCLRKSSVNNVYSTYISISF